MAIWVNSLSARYGRCRTKSQITSKAAWAEPTWLAVNPSVKLRGSRSVQSPGSPITSSAGSSRSVTFTPQLTVGRMPSTSH